MCGSDPHGSTPAISAVGVAHNWLMNTLAARLPSSRRSVRSTERPGLDQYMTSATSRRRPLPTKLYTKVALVYPVSGTISTGPGDHERHESSPRRRCETMITRDSKVVGVYYSVFLGNHAHAPHAHHVLHSTPTSDQTAQPLCNVTMVQTATTNFTLSPSPN
jgi:hypothetical protein